MNWRWRIVRVLCVGGIVIVGMLTRSPVASSTVTSRDVPGELIVSFVEQGTPVMSLPAGSFTSVYPALNSVLDECHLAEVRPIFYSNSPLQNIFVFEFPVDTDLDSLIVLMQDMPFIKRAEKNILMQVDLDYIPKNYACQHDWYCNGSDGRTDTWPFWSIQLDRAWDITRGDTSVVIAIMDSGIDYAHPYLAPNIWQNLGEDWDGDGHTLEFNGADWVLDPGDINNQDDDGNNLADDLVGWDFMGNDGDPITDLEEDFCHGTVMGSVVSCVTDTDTLGTAGITWFGKLMALRALRAIIDDYVESAWVIGATNYAAAMGADIVNMSFSTDTSTTTWHDAITAANNAGVIFVSSAGVRDGTGRDLADITKRYPQWWEEVICAAAVDTFGYKTNVGSNWGDSVDISGYSNSRSDPQGSGHVACVYDVGAGPYCPGDFSKAYPGTALPHNFYYTGLYTSGACAEASGVLALLKSMYPTASSEFLKQELYRGATPLPDPLYAQGKLGAGAINAYRSLSQWGTISENTTWSNTVYVSGDLSVASGKTLTISAGTVVNIAIDDNELAGADTTRIEFVVDGYLDVNGTAGSPVVFQAWDSSGRSDWRGITFSAQSSGGDLDYMVIKNAETGILHTAPVTLDHCTISDCEIGIASYDDLTLRNSTVTACTDYGVRIKDGSAALDVDTLSYSDQHGIDVHVYYPGAMASAMVDSCWIHDNAVCGATAGGSAVGLFLSNCTVEDNYNGVLVGDSLDWDVADCTLTGNNTGIGASGTPETAAFDVHECAIDDNTTNGVWANGGFFSVSFSTMNNNSFGANWQGTGAQGALYACELIGNQAGIKCDTGAEPVCFYNLIKQNTNGITTNNGANPILAGRHNSFIRNTAYDITNFSAFTVDAVYNYWGKAGPNPNKFYGSVAYAPYDTTQPPLPSSPAEPPTEQEPEEAYPARYALGLAHPNPFNPVTTISYDVPPPGGPVRITVYDVAGRMVKTLVMRFEGAGFHAVVWDATSGVGGSVASGVYFVRMESPAFRETRKLVVLR